MKNNKHHVFFFYSSNKRDEGVMRVITHYHSHLQTERNKGRRNLHKKQLYFIISCTITINVKINDIPPVNLRISQATDFVTTQY